MLTRVNPPSNFLLKEHAPTCSFKPLLWTSLLTCWIKTHLIIHSQQVRWYYHCLHFQHVLLGIVEQLLLSLLRLTATCSWIVCFSNQGRQLSREKEKELECIDWFADLNNSNRPMFRRDWAIVRAGEKVQLTSGWPCECGETANQTKQGCDGEAL